MFADDVAVEDREHYLPVIHCRDCHATGWASLRHGQSVQLETDLDGIYRQFFEKGAPSSLLSRITTKSGQWRTPETVSYLSETEPTVQRPVWTLRSYGTVAGTDPGYAQRA